MKSKTLMAILGILLVCFLFTSCADQASVLSTDPYGFWGGLWHGIITPFSFIGSLFSDDIAVYACDNSGGWYDFGFLIGVGGLGFTIKATT
jgi:hypothetical protein